MTCGRTDSPEWRKVRLIPSHLTVCETMLTGLPRAPVEQRRCVTPAVYAGLSRSAPKIPKIPKTRLETARAMFSKRKKHASADF